jgi:predicted site-specific integrase-resolvase
MNTYISIGNAAKMLGVSLQTLRRWDKEGKLVPERTPAGHRRYLASDVRTFNPLGLDSAALTRPTIAYARVSSHDQKEDLSRQIKVLEMYCASHGWQYEVVSDLGSGMNYRKKGLCDLLDRIASDKVGRLVLTHKDRLLRFGSEIIFAICETKHVEVVIINQGVER